MTLDELRKEAGVDLPEIPIDKTVHLTPHREVTAMLRFPSTTRPARETRPSRLLPGGSVVVVENEDGHIEYKIRYPDGHLGGVED